MKQVVLITGASQGIGKATARVFAENGFITYVTARKIAALQELEAWGCRPLALDVTDEKTMLAAIEIIEHETGGVDILINNAGYGQNGVIEELSIEQIRQQFETNVFGLLRMCQLVLPGMRKKQKGRIVNIGSVGGDFTTPGASAYHASKYALESFTDGLRGEVKQFGIVVSLIKPGGVRSNFTTVADAGYPKEMVDSPYRDFREKFQAMMTTMFDPSNKAYGVLTLEAVAKTVFQAATAPHPKTRYRVGVLAKVMPRLRRLFSDRGWDRLMLGQIGVKG
jgi:NADP-dependent 3-hydroxy acid dehydrogenase YdfG